MFLRFTAGLAVWRWGVLGLLVSLAMLPVGQAVWAGEPEGPPSALRLIEAGKWPVLETIDNGFIVDFDRSPAQLAAPQRGLTPRERLENFEILWKGIGRYYSFFELKKIDWKGLYGTYKGRVETAADDKQFYYILADLLRELKDSHVAFCNYHIPWLQCPPSVFTKRIEGKAVVTEVVPNSDAWSKGLRPGAIVTQIDGRSVEDRVEQLRSLLPSFSSERFFQDRAYNSLLAGEPGSQVLVTFLPPGEELPQQARLTRNGMPWSSFQVAFPVEKGKFVWSGKHPSGYGYLRIETFNGREEIADEFDQALEQLKDTPGLILDVRDNGGGSGVSQMRIIGRLISRRVKVATNFQKCGPRPEDSVQRDVFVTPCGPWQYTKPVVLLTDVRVGSAADLFVCMLRGTGRVTTVGTTTHGNLPGFSVCVVLPCDLVARISSAYVADAQGEWIELNGNVPQVAAEPTIRDVIEGTDSVLERAVAVLREAAPATDTVTKKSGPECDDPNGVCPQPSPSALSKVTSDTVAADEVADARLPLLEFTLEDAYGREVQASDYRGAPLLISTGACWCGGCQSDAEQLRALEEKYRARGLQVIRSVSYDGALPAWEFQKHYRFPFVQLLDPLREFENRYNSNGWPFLMLVNRQGRVVFRSSGQDWKELGERIESVLGEGSPVETIAREGNAYLPTTLERSNETAKLRPSDRFPSLACGEDGRVYVAFTTSRHGTQDVYLRVFDGQQWLPDQPVAASEADEFDGAVLVDRENRPWVCWTSNAPGAPYNIFVSCLAEAGQQGKPTQLTHAQANDDAMHARLAQDAQGRMWIAYYQWERIHGRSRDKEVYARYRGQDAWSDAIRVSPDDVPVWEDHTDPVLTAYGDGVLVGWSWDFHRQNACPAYSSVPDNSSIFLRTITPEGPSGRARPLSGSLIDTRPTLVGGPEGPVFCAWESAVPQRRFGTRKAVFARVEDLSQAEQPGVSTNVSGPQKDICTPCLARGRQGDVALVWSQCSKDDRWVLKQAHWNTGEQRWDSPKELQAEGNPRFPSAAFGPDGRLWVAYCREGAEQTGLEVLVEEP